MTTAPPNEQTARQGHAPRISTRRARLRPVDAGDYPLLYELAVNPAVGTLLRFRGATPDPDTFARSVWEHVLAQFIVTAEPDDQPVGLVVLSSPDFANGYAYLSALSIPEWHHTGLMIHGIGMLIEHAFHNWSFRKLYAECITPSYNTFKSGNGRYFTEQACLPEREFVAGTYQDLHILAIDRNQLGTISATLDRLG